ncbi:MAG: DegT/DnrJ/EryC1/StrS family aminotransferase [Butyricimonas faecihominis]
MEAILDFAQQHDLFIVEDNAQAIGAIYSFRNGTESNGNHGRFRVHFIFPSKI